jgi:Trk K+ transport system NAD-binding subunit
VVRNFDPRLLPLHQSFRHRVVSSTVWGAQQIETLLHHPEEQSLLSLGASEIEVFDLRVSGGWAGRTVRELLSGLEAVPVTLTREGIAELARPESALTAGALLKVATVAGCLAELQARIATAETPEEA